MNHPNEQKHAIFGWKRLFVYLCFGSCYGIHDVKRFHSKWTKKTRMVWTAALCITSGRSRSMWIHECELACLNYLLSPHCHCRRQGLARSGNRVITKAMYGKEDHYEAKVNPFGETDISCCSCWASPEKYGEFATQGFIESQIQFHLRVDTESTWQWVYPMDNMCMISIYLFLPFGVEEQSFFFFFFFERQMQSWL